LVVDLLVPLGELPPDHLHEELPFGPEVTVEGSFGQLGGGGDISHGYGAVTPLDEQVSGDAKQEPARTLRLRRLSRGRRHEGATAGRGAARTSGPVHWPGK